MGSCTYKWQSQLLLSDLKGAGNLLVTGGIFFSGIPFAKFESFAKLTNLKFTGKGTFVFPMVRSVWQNQQASVFAELKSRDSGVVLAGDGQAETALIAEVSERNTPFANRMAKKHAVEQAKKNLPSTPEKKAEVVAVVTQSPRIRKVLQKRGLMKTPEEEKEVVVLKVLASDLMERIKAVKKDRSNEARAALGAAKSLSFGKNVRKSRSQKTLSKLIALNTRIIKSGIRKRERILKGEEASWLETKRKTRRDAVSEETKETVYDY